jgi:hypothetical protein
VDHAAVAKPGLVREWLALPLPLMVPMPGVAVCLPVGVALDCPVRPLAGARALPFASGASSCPVAGAARTGLAGPLGRVLPDAGSGAGLGAADVPMYG